MRRVDHPAVIVLVYSGTVGIAGSFESSDQFVSGIGSKRFRSVIP